MSVGARVPVETLVAAVEASGGRGDHATLAKARELVAAVLAMHAEGLARVMELANASPAVAEALASDALVGSLLVLHGLHPRDLAARVQAALDGARFRDRVSFAIDEGTVRVRCAPALRAAVEEALVAAAPDAAVIVEADALIPADRLLRRDERCELCAAPIAGDHGHVYDREARVLSCTCDACARVVAGRWRRVVRRAERIADPAIAKAVRASLGVPIELAFVRRAPLVVAYPSPAGIVESPLEEAAWRAVVACEARLADLDETEALLVHRDRAFRVSIDVCFHLTAIVRRTWRGMSGGPDVMGAIDAFFAELAP